MMILARSQPSTGNVWDDVTGGVLDFVSEPSNWVRALTLVGWPSFVISMLPGALGPAAQTVFIALPGLVKGDSVADAFVGEVTWRAKAYSQYLSAEKAYTDIASAAETKRVLLDPIQTATSAGSYGEDIERRVRDLKYMYPDATPAQILSKVDGLTPASLLTRLKAECTSRSPDPDLCRDDALALVANYVAHANVFSTKDFDLATGKRIDDPSALHAWRKYQLEQAQAAKAAAVRAWAQEHGVQLQMPDVVSRTSVPYLRERWAEENAKFYPGRNDALVRDLRTQLDAALERELATQTAAEQAARDAATPPLPLADARPRRRSLLGDVLTFSILTAPAWIPLLLVPALRQRANAAPRRRPA